MDPVTAALITEAVKLILDGAFKLARISNMSKEELQKAFDAGMALLAANDPANLPDPS